MCEYMCACACVCVCACMCARAMHVCVCMCVHSYIYLSSCASCMHVLLIVCLYNVLVYVCGCMSAVFGTHWTFFLCIMHIFIHTHKHSCSDIAASVESLQCIQILQTLWSRLECTWSHTHEQSSCQWVRRSICLSLYIWLVDFSLW